MVPEIWNDKRIRQQIRTLDRLMDAYRGDEPFARFLTKFYRQNRQMGSSDRRMASRMAYNLFRIGRAALDLERQDRLALAEFLCTTESDVVRLLLPHLYPQLTADVSQKIALLEEDTAFRLNDVFPFTAHLSAGVDKRAFVHSLFVQPLLFIRVRKGKTGEVSRVLDKSGIAYEKLNELTWALPNGTALTQVAGIQGSYEVQDQSSQQTLDYFEANTGEHWWDACAGSGGKSLLLMDKFPTIDLLVSDTRNSILRNLDERFDLAGVKSYRRKIIDLSKGTGGLLDGELFDGIVLDAPCTGSGTWGRTPEQISFFDAATIQRFSKLQKKIAANAAKHLQVGKPLIYITCSVFADENERVVSHLQEYHSLRLERIDLLKGYQHRADSMFVARLVRY